MWIYLLLAAGGLTVLIDRAARAVVLHALGDGRSIGANAMALRLHPCEHPLLGGRIGRKTLLALWLLGAGCAGVAAAAVPSPGSDALGAGLGLALGGAASNLRDRVAGRAIVDYIAVGRWPVFNVADVAIVAGAVLAVASVFT